ncbi:MAG: alpha/beta hydrolase [Deltaproteobacteria bacterium]|nr:alpha/beta hydrolase [Deltaproteobacteria bacterium]MCB9788016.1 alpha/beta hydrolase [Deltaproteobacteria bacterium]
MIRRFLPFLVVLLTLTLLGFGCATTRTTDTETPGPDASSGTVETPPPDLGAAEGAPDPGDLVIGSGKSGSGGVGRGTGTGTGVGEVGGLGGAPRKSKYAGRKTRGGGTAAGGAAEGTRAPVATTRPKPVDTAGHVAAGAPGDAAGSAPGQVPGGVDSPPVGADPTEASGAGAGEPAGAEPANAQQPPPAEVPGLFDAPAEKPDQKKVYPRSTEPVSVPVYYGTDRAPVVAADALSAAQRALGWTALISLVLAGALVWRARRRGTRRAWLLAGFTGVVALVVIANAAFPVLRGQARTEIVYGAERGELVTGIVDVTIPPGHVVGQIEAPSLLTFEVTDDEDRHIVLQSIEQLPADDFYAALRERVSRGRDRSAFVFVHGYATTFEEAAQRTAQIAYDLDFDGAPMMFSWPSQGTKIGYSVDEANAEWAVGHMKQFLERVAKEVGPGTVHLLAHSMGNRVLTKALQLMPPMPEGTPRFREVMLAAPDIDASTFKDQIAPAIMNSGARVTLYASANDEALLLSKKVHGYPRAGDAGDGLVVVAGVDTVDASRVETSLTGHSYFGDNRTVLDDIFRLVRLGMPVDRRPALEAREQKGLRYWEFVPPPAAAHAD